MAETTVQSPPHSPPPAAPGPTPPKRPNRSPIRRLIYEIRGRLTRLSFSREGFIAGLKTLASVSLMTVLIWIYAEREQTAKQTVSFRCEARNNDPNLRVVKLISSSPDGLTRADLSGPQARLQQVKEILDGAPLQVDIPDMEPGHHLVDTSALLANHPLFVKYGQTVANPNPQRIDIFIDPIDRRELEVKVRPSITNLDSVVFDPPTIVVSGPKSVLDAASAQGNLVAYADLKDLQGQGYKEIPSVQVNIAVSDPHVTITPTNVAAKVTIKKLEVSGYAMGVPIWVLYPPGRTWDKGKADLAVPNISDVPVIGPAEMFAEGIGPEGKKALIYKINEARAMAILDVSTAPIRAGQAPNGETFDGEIRFDFGKTGVRAAPEAQKSVQFKYVERVQP